MRKCKRAMLRLICVFCAAMVFGAPHIAAASPLKAKIKATVAQSCAVAFINEDEKVLDLGSPADAFDESVNFTVDCNTPFEYKLISKNGGLKNVSNVSGAQPGSDGFAAKRSYSTKFTLPLEDGDTDSINDFCPDAAGLTAGSTSPCALSDSGSAIALGKTGTLTVRGAASDAIFLPGKYTDSLEITISYRN